MVHPSLTPLVTELRMEQRTMTDKSDPVLTLILLTFALCLFSVVGLGLEELTQSILPIALSQELVN
jgi:hypothetical protein